MITLKNILKKKKLRNTLLINSNDSEAFFIISYFQNKNQIIFNHLTSYIKKKRKMLTSALMTLDKKFKVEVFS